MLVLLKNEVQLFCDGDDYMKNIISSPGSINSEFLIVLQNILASCYPTLPNPFYAYHAPLHFVFKCVHYLILVQGHILLGQAWTVPYDTDEHK